MQIDLMEEVESRLYGIVSDTRERVIGQLCSVLGRLPDDDLGLLFTWRNVKFILPESCTASPLFLMPLSPDKSREPLVPVWLICLRTDLLNASSAEFVYTVAHELAHAFLEHGATGSPGEQPIADPMADARAIEIAADKKVVEWGFETELMACPHNYLHGDGLRNWGLEHRTLG